MATKRTLATKDSSKLLNFMAYTDPVLRDAIDLPQQGADIKKIGEIIMSNTRYKNAFINAVNVIALTLIIDDAWANPWEDFTNQGIYNYQIGVWVKLHKRKPTYTYYKNGSVAYETEVCQ